MSDRLFSLAQQIEQIKQQSQAGFSEATEFNENDSESISENRLFQLEQSLGSKRHTTQKGQIIKTSSKQRSSFAQSLSQGNFAEQLTRQEEAKLTNIFHHKRFDIHYFVDNLFLPNVRSELQNKIKQAINSNEKEAWLIETTELDIMLNAWYNIWKKKLGFDFDQALLDKCHISDIKLIEHLCTYVNKHKLYMHVPNIKEDGLSETKVNKYILTDYTKLQIYGQNEVDVKKLLKLFAAGAHFVAIHSKTDIPNSPQIDNFFDGFTLDSAPAASHSHYAGVNKAGNIKSAIVYPNFIHNDITPAICPFIVSLLTGRTAYWVMSMLTGYPNTFFQLEGWPATNLTREIALIVGNKLTANLIDASRHMQDFHTHNLTKWNISTYGACPYSEKRGTTVFLAPESWKPQKYSTYSMYSYVGMETANLDTNLIR